MSANAGVHQVTGGLERYRAGGDLGTVVDVRECAGSACADSTRFSLDVATPGCRSCACRPSWKLVAPHRSRFSLFFCFVFCVGGGGVFCTNLRQCVWGTIKSFCLCYVL